MFAKIAIEKKPLSASLLGVCRLCRGILEFENHAFCYACSDALPWLHHPCSHCAMPLDLPALSSVCGTCQKSPPLYNRCIAALCYEPPVNDLIAHIKTHVHAPETHQLGRQLAMICEATYNKTWPDMIIPVPLHWTRTLQRGFNQSDNLAHYIQMSFPKIEIRGDLCKRLKKAPTQHSQSRRRRFSSIENAFTCSTPVSGRRIAIVDDGVTTGATATALTRALLNAGAANVDVWCIARTDWHNTQQ